MSYSMEVGWRESRAAGWLEYLKTLETHESLLRERETYYYRGQADAGWQLIPTFLRCLAGTKTQAAAAHKIEERLLRHFRSRAHMFLPDALVQENEWSILSWWMLMQHHSCPTRLLDWTMSPYVATYFAVERLSERDGAVWFFPAEPLARFAEKRGGPLSELEAGTCFLCPVNEPAVYPISAEYETPRSVAQQSVFTVGSVATVNHDGMIRSTLFPNTDELPAYKIVIPARLKMEFLHRLRQMNISAATLFPGADGLGRSLWEDLRVQIWRG